MTLSRPWQRFAALAVLACAAVLSAQSKPAAGDAQITRAAGTIKSSQENLIVVTPDAGGETSAILSATTKILRVPPGEKDLKNAVPLTAQDLQPGDRVLVRGQASPDGHSIAALAVIVMKQGDVSARQQRDREDWQKRGVDGLVTAVDPAAGTITISSGGLAARKIKVLTTKNTILHRYAPNSVKFEDAEIAPLDQIKPGDQLRARGTRNAGGSELSAEEVISGTFRSIAGTISAVDAAANTLTVQDAIGKTSVLVKFSADSQMKKLSAEIAQRIAMRLKGADDASAGNQKSAAPAGTPSGAPGGMRGPGGGQGGNAASNLQRILSRMPNATLADVQKGDAVMILSTDGTGADSVTATAPPPAPWTYNASGGEGEGQP